MGSGFQAFYEQRPFHARCAGTSSERAQIRPEGGCEPVLAIFGASGPQGLQLVEPLLGASVDP